MSGMGLSRKQVSRLGERGMVSIMVTLVLMIVISLIVLGFAQVSRRNQRQQLDRQLSTQAFYAAETGINDVHKLISGWVTAGQPVNPKTNCANTGNYASLTNVIDAAANVSYSCLTVDPSPPSLQYGNVGTTSTVVPIKSADGSGISKLTFTWQSKSNNSTPTTNCPTTLTNVFSNVANWKCDYGVLRFDLVPTVGSLTADGLRQDTMTSFVVPMRSGGNAAGSTIPYLKNTTNTNSRYGLICTNTNCTLSVNALGQNYYYLRVSSLYKDASLQITASNAAGGALELEGAQVVIDATGKAQDVLRRIQVRMPLLSNSENALPDNAIQSTDSICKRFAVMEDYFDNVVPSVTSTNPLCDP